MSSDTPPLVCHVIYRFDVGGLENGLVNLINGLAPARFRHAVVSLTEVTSFADPLAALGVKVFALKKRPGKDPGVYFRMHRLLRILRPSIVHTRNLGTLDHQPVARLAGVPVRVHGEHGWDIHDPGGLSPRYLRLRRVIDPLVHRYVALSNEIEVWLEESVRVDGRRITRICNGVDTERFRPRRAEASASSSVTFGTVTRFSEIKDPLNVVCGFAALRRLLPDDAPSVRLLMVGDGPLRAAVEEKILELGVQANVELAGSQSNVLPWLHRMDAFVLGSRREGISNTILEAMACGLPVIATRTGGNPELIEEGCTGRLVPPSDPASLAVAMKQLVLDAQYRARAGAAARCRAVGRFSLAGMIERYATLYDELLEVAN